MSNRNLSYDGTPRDLIDRFGNALEKITETLDAIIEPVERHTGLQVSDRAYRPIVAGLSVGGLFASWGLVIALREWLS